jgi:ribosome-binding ATPase YchF (GTP1/OBG family)
VLTVYKEHLLKGLSARTAPVEEEDKEYIADLWLLTAKPVLYICNVDEGSVNTGNAYVDKGREAVKDAEGAGVLVISAQIEAEIAELESFEEREMFLNDMGLTESGVNKLIKAAYKLLNLATYFTAGVQEVRAWTITQGFTAPQAAGVIHTDFEKGFIRAEVIKYDEFVKYNGSEAAIKEAGKLGVEGKSTWLKMAM